MYSKRGQRSARGDEVAHELALQVDRFADPELGRFEARGEHLFADLRRAVLVTLEGTLGATGLDHHDRDVGVDGVAQGASGDDQLEVRGVAFGEGGVRNPLTVVGVRHAHGPDRAVEGDARDHERGGGGVDREDVVRVLLVGAEDRADDLDLVAKALREGRAQRAVDESTDQDRLVGQLALAAKERPGDLAGGVGALFDVDREGKEIHSLSSGLRGGDRGEQHGVAETREYGAVGQLGEVTGLK